MTSTVKGWLLDTRARMWTAMVLASPHRLARHPHVVSATLTKDLHSALASVSPALGDELKAKIRNAPQPTPHALDACHEVLTIPSPT